MKLTKQKLIKVWGCPGCGSELKKHEIEKGKQPCRFCCYEGKLEYLGEFHPAELYPEFR
jgi:hypothetical protein